MTNFACNCKFIQITDMLIAIEGLDGSGKTTQVEMAREYLSTLGKLRYEHFPRFDAPVFGRMLSMFLRGEFGSIDKVHPMLVALLFAEDRRSASPQIRQWLDEGDIVLLDRYVYSNIAFQGAKTRTAEECDSLARWILDTEYAEFGIPRPDINLFLDVPLDFIDGRLKERRCAGDREYLHGKADIHESDMGFQARVREVYLKQCSADPHFIRIDCSGPDGGMLPAGTIFGKIKEHIDNALQGHRLP